MQIMNAPDLRELAPDLRKQPPRSPHEKLGGYVIAARCLDKCRASLVGLNGEYNFHPCGLAAFLWNFTGVTPDQFKNFVATGASDSQVGNWLKSNSKVKDRWLSSVGTTR
jgi:hypothetical protein